MGGIVVADYRGNRAGKVITVEVDGEALDPRVGLSDGDVELLETLDWSTEIGREQLALAILAHRLRTTGIDPAIADQRAQELCREFSRAALEWLPEGQWVMSGEQVDAAVVAIDDDMADWIMDFSAPF